MVLSLKHVLIRLFKAVQVTLVCILSVSLPVQASSYQKTIVVNNSHPNLLQTDFDGKNSGMDYTLSGGGTWDSFASNDVTVNYNVNTLTTSPGPISISNNKLTIKNGNFTFNGDEAAARFTLNNNINNPTTTVDVTGFDLSLTGNTLNLTGGLSESTGSLYGALFETTNSAVGVGSVSNNNLNLTSPGLSEAKVPNLIGGAIRTNMTDRSLDTTNTVTGNTVTVNAKPNDVVKSDIVGGQSVTSIDGFDGVTSYVVKNTVDSNIVNLQKGTFDGKITGGLATLSNTTTKVQDGSLQGNVSHNQVNITGGTYEGAIIIGGRASLEGDAHGFSNNSSISVNNNKVTISGGQLTDTLVIGGASTYDYSNDIMTGAITNNTIEISGDTVLQGGTTLVGGYTNGNNSVTNNTLSIKKKGLTAFGVDGFTNYEFDNLDTASAGDTYLTVTHGNGHNNPFFDQYESVRLQNSAVNVDSATFSWTAPTAPLNMGLGQNVALLKTTSFGLSGTIANNETQTDIVNGSDTYSYKIVQTNNAVYLLHSGLTTTGDWNQNVSMTAADFSGGDVAMTVGGTLTAASIWVTGNELASATLKAPTLDVTSQSTTMILNGTSADQVTFTTINVGDGQTLSKSGSGFYGFSTMNIAGSGAVTSLDAMSASNTVNLTGGASPVFDTINLGDGSTLTVSGGSYGFNTFNVYGNADTLTGDLNGAGKNVNFYLSDTTAPNATALTVTGAADLTDSNVKVGITGSSSPLKKEDQVILVDAASGITGVPANQTGVGMHGLLLAYDFDLSVVGSQLLATVTKAGLTEESKAFLEGRASSLAALSQGSDFVTQQAMESAINAATAREDKSFALFTAFGGGKSRYETGSHVDVTGFNALVGLSHAVSIFNADFVLASFVEYGTGSYNSYNSFASGRLKGSGDTDYMGIGAMGRWLGKNNTYIDASLRGGKVSTDFKGNVFFADRAATYDYDTFYFGGHFGMGYLMDASDDFKLDLYARYILTRQNGKNVTISSGDRLHFDPSLSSRVRVGARADLFNTDAWRPYIGAALDYEFNGKANATAYGMHWDAPSLKGASGVGEVGLTWLRGDWTFGAGLEGYVGQRQGITGNVKVGYQF